MVGLSSIESQCHSNLPVVTLCIICEQTCHEACWHYEKIVFVTISPLQLKSVHFSYNRHDFLIVWVIIFWDFNVKSFGVKFNVIVFFLFNCILHTLSIPMLGGFYSSVENWHWFSVRFSMRTGQWELSWRFSLEVSCCFCMKAPLLWCPKSRWSLCFCASIALKNRLKWTKGAKVTAPPKVGGVVFSKKSIEQFINYFRTSQKTNP